MKRFCPNCGSPIDGIKKFCPKCGAPLTEDCNAAIITEDSSKENPSKKQLPIIVGILAIVAAVGGGFYFYTARQAPASSATNTEAPIAASSSAASNISQKEEHNAVAQKEDKLTIAQKQAAILGYPNIKFKATSYGSNSNGFLAMNQKGQILFFDTKNNRCGIGLSPDAFNLMKTMINSGQSGSVNALIEVWKDSHDKDVESGSWNGSSHKIPLHISFLIDNGRAVDNGIMTGSGAQPYSYDSYLYEQKNVDLVHLFLTDIVPLYEDAAERAK